MVGSFGMAVLFLAFALTGWTWNANPSETDVARNDIVVADMTCEATAQDELVPGGSLWMPEWVWHRRWSVHLRKHWNWAPFLQREVLTASYDIEEATTRDVVCRKALGAYHRS